MASSSNSRYAIGCPRLVPELVSIAIPGTQYQTLPTSYCMYQYYAILRATFNFSAGPVNQVLCEAKQVWQNMLLLYVLLYHRAYNTYCINTGIWYQVLRYGHRLVQQQQYEYIHAVVHRAFDLLHFRHYYCCNNGCCCCSHNNSWLQCSSWSQDRLR